MRIEPEIGKTKNPISYQNPGDDSLGCIFVLPFLIAGYFILLAIVHVISGIATRAEQITSFIVFIGIAFLLARGIISLYQDSAAMAVERKKWIEACTVTRVKIVSRCGGVHDDGYRYYSSWFLTLEVNPNQVVLVKVSQCIYNSLEKCSDVRIYYMPQNPMVFLLENEILLLK